MWHVIYINTVEYYSALKRWKFSSCIQIYISVYVSVDSDTFIYPFPILIIFIYFSWCWNVLSKCLTALREAVSSVSSVFDKGSLGRWKYFKTALSFWWVFCHDWLLDFVRWFSVSMKGYYVFSTLLCECVYVFYFSTLMLGNWF